MKPLSMIIVGILAIVVLIFAMTYFITFLFVMIGFFAFCGAIGFPITIKADGKKIGYIRWTKFYPSL